jgi:hypothetical protein
MATTSKSGYKCATTLRRRDFASPSFYSIHKIYSLHHLNPLRYIIVVEISLWKTPYPISLTHLFLTLAPGFEAARYPNPTVFQPF